MYALMACFLQPFVGKCNSMRMPVHYRAWCRGLQAGGGADIDFTWEVIESPFEIMNEICIQNECPADFTSARSCFTAALA